MAVAAPKDTENLMTKIDALEKTEGDKLVAFVKAINADIEALKLEVKFIFYYLFLTSSLITLNSLIILKKEKLTNLPPLEDMTVELKAYYFPEKCGHLNAFETYGEKDNLTLDFKLKGT